MSNVKLSARQGNCDHDQFWDVVREIGWGSGHVDDQQVVDEICRRWSPEFFESFCEQHGEVFMDLRPVIAEQDHGGSDDGLDDVTNHIIGCGREAVEGAFRDPAAAFAQYELEAVESFAYCMHVDEKNGVLVPMC